jgi:DNA-binding transcriptional MerR regulator
MLKHTNFFTIKEAVQITGVPAPTLRYYEELGLLDPVQRAKKWASTVYRSGF